MTNTQRRGAQRKPVDASGIRIEVSEGLGSNWARADVIDLIEGGFGVKVLTPLKSGSIIVVRGKLGGDSTADHLKAGVKWCVGRPDGTFRAGLEFLERSTAFPLDCYEMMQLSPNADLSTISRVYRMLASQYHPDNAETGNSEKFIRLSKAYQILSDPEKRARFDAGYRESVRLREKIFAQVPASNGTEEGRNRSERAKVPFQGTANESRFVPSVGALRGWNTALRRPGA